MATSGELHYLTIGAAAPLIAAGELSPVTLTRAYLDRIAAVDARLDSYVTLTADLALSQARQAEAEIAAGRYRGPMHGIPIALKDLYDTAGIRTTAMSRVTPDRVPAADATAVTRLYDAGAILLGKLAMHEFALGGPDFTSLFPPARNPWNTDHIPGGSSSGSGAAVAAGLCMGALGSDTGGSIRGPAAMCGIAGIKPTFGRVSNYGVAPLSWSQDHCGPIDLDRRGLRHYAPGHRRLRPQGPHHRRCSHAQLPGRPPRRRARPDHRRPPPALLRGSPRR